MPSNSVRIAIESASITAWASNWRASLGLKRWRLILRIWWTAVFIPLHLWRKDPFEICRWKAGCRKSGSHCIFKAIYLVYVRQIQFMHVAMTLSIHSRDPYISPRFSKPVAEQQVCFTYAGRGDVAVHCTIFKTWAWLKLVNISIPESLLQLCERQRRKTGGFHSLSAGHRCDEYISSMLMWSPSISDLGSTRQVLKEPP